MQVVKGLVRLGTFTISILFAITAQASPVTLDFWHSMTGDKSQVLEKIATEFNSLPVNKEKVQIKLTYVGTYTDGINKLRTSLMAGKSPHIAQIYEIGTQVMIDSGAITPLEDLIAGDKEFGMGEMLPQVLRYYRVNGRLFSLPFATSNPVIYYNADLFAKAGIKTPPKTFEELAEDAEKLTNKEAKLTGVTWPINSWFFEQFLAKQGAVFLDHDNGRSGRATKANFNSPEGLRYTEFLVGLIKNGVFANVGKDWEPPVMNFMSGRTAILVTSTSDVFAITEKAPFKVSTAPLPVPAGMEKVAGGTVIGGNSLWILSKKPTMEQKLAYEFVKFMASAPIQRLWHTRTGYFPIRKDVIASLESEGFYKKNPNAKTAIDQLLNSAEVPATQGALTGVFPETREHIESAIEEVLAGKSDVRSALTKAASRTEIALARYNKMQEGRKKP